MTLDEIARGLKASGVPVVLVEELADSYQEAKDRFARSDHRPNRVEGGRFSEAVFRILQFETTGSYTPIGDTLPSSDSLVRDFGNLPRNGSHSDAIRLHIPRTLRLIYDIRNKRDSAHLGPVDAGLQDATLVVHCMDWVLAELVREKDSTITHDEVQVAIDGIMAKAIPAIQVMDDFPVILRDLPASDYVLVLLYWQEPQRVSYINLRDWVRPTMRTNLRRTLNALVARLFVHGFVESDDYRITHLGQEEVVRRRLLD